jgi:putative acyl-CoA dehydrogenase
VRPPAAQPPYRFDDYLDRRARADWWGDDPFVQRLVRRQAGSAFRPVDQAARAVSAKASGRWRELADASALPESRPRLVQRDAHGRRLDRIVRPAEVELLEREVFAEALFSPSTDPLVRTVKQYLIYQLGEAGVACPLVCTEGLAVALRRLADRPETLAIRDHLEEGRAGRFAVGAQFLTEIQAGSDVPANRVEAVEDGGAWRLHGSKFFCSVAHADYAAVTARPRGAEALGLFVMPMWAPGEEGRRRNGLTIDRLKPKLGTCELPTAEITLDGALAWPLGPLERGLANVVGLVLTTSRLTVGLASAAYLARATREAKAYADFRVAFGRPIGAFAMVRAQLEDLELASRRATAGAFEMARRVQAAAGGPTGPSAEPAARRAAFEARLLVMLQKVVASEDATLGLREAMGLLGGNGVIEDFSCLPRLFRDSAVNELWEGPRNVLLAQVHRDLQRAAAWYPPAEVVGSLLGAPADGVARQLGAEVADLVSLPDLADGGAATVLACRRWDAACRALVHAFQDAEVARVEG